MRNVTFLAALLFFMVCFGRPLGAQNIKIVGTGQSLSLQVSGIADEYQLITGQTATHLKFGVGGMEYAGLKQGTAPYASSIAWGGDIIDVIHGERDNGLGATRAQYLGYLNEWRSDYADDLGFDVPMITDQMSSAGSYYDNALVSQVALAQWDAARLNPSIYLVGPKYQYEYDSTQVHLTAADNLWNGEQHGKVIAAVLGGTDWRPLEPMRAQINGSTVTIYFHVPVPPLRIDTTTLPPKPFYGFEWQDSTGAQITAVSIGYDTVTLTLDRSVTSGAVRYAYTGTPDLHSRWGNIKDSDDTPSLNGNDLANWLVHFEVEVSNNYFLPHISGGVMGYP